MNYFKKIVGDRIYLSPKGISDEEIEKFTEWLNDFQVTDYTRKSGQITTLAEEKEWYENAGKNRDDFYVNGKHFDKLHMDILESEFKGDYIRNKNIK